METMLQRIETLVDRQGTALIGSVDENGFPNMKAMLPPRKRIGIETFYFTTNTSSLRVKQYETNNKACLYFYDGRLFEGVLLVGQMEVLQDAASKEMVWREGDTLYYSQGVADPDYCVLKFSAQTGRYYKNFSSESFTVNECL